ncbi:MAG: signal peptidase I [Clostridiales bacterium]|nr:signal peptidase I [Clostridiales bacterium]
MSKDDFNTPLPSTEQLEQELKQEESKKRYHKTIRTTVYTLLVVAAVAVLIVTLLFPVMEVSSNSMAPTVNDGDILVLYKTDRYETGDLCAFYWQNKLLIKRIIAGPGDFVSMDAAGTVSVNGAVLSEPYIVNKAYGECDLTFPYQVPDGKYFVMGDERAISIDSRSSVIGCVGQDQFVGKAIVRIWPIFSFKWFG